MKISLTILALFVAASAYAVNKKSDFRQGGKALDKKYFGDMPNDTPQGKTLSHGVEFSQDRTQQLESKKSRQYQEERPVKK